MVAGSRPFAGPASRVAGPTRGLQQLLPAAEAPSSVLQEQQACPLTAGPAAGEWLALLPASLPLAVGCPEPSLVSQSRVSSRSRPVTCLHM